MGMNSELAPGCPEAGPGRGAGLPVPAAQDRRVAEGVDSTRRSIPRAPRGVGVSG
jgi:hypothetical protein